MKHFLFEPLFFCKLFCFFFFFSSLLSFLFNDFTLSCFLIMLVFILISNLIEIYFLIFVKVIYWLSNNFFNSWKSKQGKWVPYLSNIKAWEWKYEFKLMLFIVSNERNKSTWRLIYQVLVLFHIFFDFNAKIFITFLKFIFFNSYLSKP